jgi:hypothetical protein
LIQDGRRIIFWNVADHFEDITDEGIGGQSVDSASLAQVDFFPAGRTGEAEPAGHVSIQASTAIGMEAR